MFVFCLEQNISNPALQYWLHASSTEHQNILSVWMAFILSRKKPLVFHQKVTKAQEQILLFIIRQFKMVLGIFEKLFPDCYFHVLSSPEKEIVFIHFPIA